MGEETKQPAPKRAKKELIDRSFIKQYEKVAAAIEKLEFEKKKLQALCSHKHLDGSTAFVNYTCKLCSLTKY